MIEFEEEQRTEGNLVGTVVLLMVGFMLGVLVTAACYHMVIK
jgi:hypothetical protein